MADKTNQIWCTDFTYIFLTNGSMRYNCTIIDLYDRSVVASETGKWITSDLAIMALEKAIHFQNKKPKNLILHSDQGSQSSPMFGTIRSVHTRTTSIERPLRQDMDWIDLDSGVTKMLDHNRPILVSVLVGIHLKIVPL